MNAYIIIPMQLGYNALDASLPYGMNPCCNGSQIGGLEHSLMAGELSPIEHMVTDENQINEPMANNPVIYLTNKNRANKYPGTQRIYKLPVKGYADNYAMSSAGSSANYTGKAVGY